MQENFIVQDFRPLVTGVETIISRDRLDIITCHAAKIVYFHCCLVSSGGGYHSGGKTNFVCVTETGLCFSSTKAATCKMTKIFTKILWFKEQRLFYMLCLWKNLYCVLQLSVLKEVGALFQNSLKFLTSSQASFDRFQIPVGRKAIN